MPNKRLRFFAKTGRRDQHALACQKSFQASGKALHDGPPYNVLPSFGLDVHGIKAELVLLEDAVNPEELDREA